MSKRRNLFAQFGSVKYSSGQVLNGNALPNAGLVTLEFNETKGAYYASPAHDDQFIDFGSNFMPISQNKFATYHTFDLRDLMKTNEGMFDVVVDIQRAYAAPATGLTYNPGPGNIEETLLIVLGDCDLEQIAAGDPDDFPMAGFVQPTAITNANQLGKHTSVVYAENRVYREGVMDRNQFNSNAGSAGSFGGPGVGSNPAEFVSVLIPGWNLVNEIKRGYDQLIVGPYLTVIRSWNIYPADRTIQSYNGGGPSDFPAEVFTYGAMQVEVITPALQVNVSGNQKALSDTQIAAYYSEMLIQ